MGKKGLRMNLQTKLMVLFVLGVAVSVGLVGLFTIRVMRRDLEGQIANNHLLLARSLGAQRGAVS
ncbi:MAG: hypothetical protein GX182_04175 [Firmicutes bacterium]|jgi:sensor histidine kinase regulating citrate/malate metabolism|nr:hypothetical protein [Bacillota bacterium]